jgi:hypothetical protein
VDYDKDKVDEMTLAIMFLVMSRVGQGGGRAWKGIDAQTLDRLFKKGWIGDPMAKSPSVEVTPEGIKKAEDLFKKYFQSP